MGISYEEYQKIWYIWYHMNKEERNRVVGVDDWVRFLDLERLAFGRLLNDNVINAYIGIINRSILGDGGDKDRVGYAILDTLKVSNLFENKASD